MKKKDKTGREIIFLCLSQKIYFATLHYYTTALLLPPNKLQQLQYQCGLLYWLTETLQLLWNGCTTLYVVSILMID